MFKIKSDPTFDASLTLIGQGKEQKLNVTFRHKTRSDYQGLFQSIADGKMGVPAAVLELVEKWDADAPLTAESVTLLGEHQPGADWAILTGYAEALAVARKGN